MIEFSGVSSSERSVGRIVEDSTEGLVEIVGNPVPNDNIGIDGVDDGT